MPLGLALLAAGCLGSLVLYNTGQLATDKARLANTADAAAYSGLVWQARAMNYQAYTNRAMVANQVAIGQAVSLNSWTTYGDKTAENINTVLGGVPFVGAFTNGLAQVMRGIDLVVDPVTRAIVAVADTVETGLSLSQEAMFVSSFVATPDVVRKLVAASDPRFDVDTAFSLAGLAVNLNSWNSFTESYESDDIQDMTERGGVIIESRDRFTTARNWEFFDDIWMYTTPLTKHKIFREGQTHLAMREENGEMHWEWMAKDTMSFQTVLLRPWRIRKSKRKKWIEVEIGWGEAYANDENRDSRVLSSCERGATQGCGYVNRNKRAEAAADRDNRRLANYNGVKAFRSLSEDTREHEDKDPKLRLRIEVALLEGDTVSANHGVDGITQGPFHAPLETHGNVLSSVSVAEVHYRRPDAHGPSGRGREREIANGYNPYWDVRLAPISTVDRLGAVALRALDGGGGGTDPDTGSSGSGLGRYDEDDATQGTNGDAPTGGSGLGAYPTSLAGAFGVEGTDLTVAPMTLDGVAGLALGDPVDQFRDGLEAEVRSIPERLFSAAVQAAADAAQDYANDAIASSPTATAVQSWIDAGTALNDEFEAIKEQVTEDFTDALEEGVALYNEAVAPFLTDIEAKRRELDDYEARLTDGREYVEEEAQRLREAVDDVGTQLSDARDALVESLRVRMVEIIRDRSGGAAWAIDLMDNMSSETIETILDDYFEGAGEEGLEELVIWDADR